MRFIHGYSMVLIMTLGKKMVYMVQKKKAEMKYENKGMGTS
jgi:hypothetical protein